MTINERFQKIINELHLGNKRAFSQSIGVAPTVIENIVGKRKGNPSFEVIQKVVYANENINTEWLLTGNGEFYKNKKSLDLEPLTDINNCKSDKKIEKQEIPIYDIHAAAGLKLLFDGNKQNVIDSIRIPNMSKCDGAMFITGDSMYPLMKSGDIVLFKQIHNIDYLHFGDIYILSYDINGDEYLVIKYIQRSEIQGHIKLVSYNKYHEPIDIPLDAVRAIALVKANVRYNTMQ